MEGVDRCSTGIIGFDKICQGGFVRNSTNVLIGGPGSGKTTFMLNFLWNGVTKFNEPGLYCSFEPDIVETLNDARGFGWDFSKLNQNGKVHFLKFSPRTSVSELKSELTKMISRFGVKRICFDPISVLSLNLEDKGKVREAIFDLVSLMKRLRVTCVLSDESAPSVDWNEPEPVWPETDIIKFLCDSIVILYGIGISGVSDRALKISKMRRTSHYRNPVGMDINEKGIFVISNNVVSNK